MRRAAAQQLLRQLVVVSGALQQVRDIGLFDLLGLVAVALGQPGGKHLVVIPVAGIDGHRRGAVIIGLQPGTHAIAFFGRVAFLQIRKAQPLLPARQVAKMRLRFADLFDEISQAHRAGSQAAVPAGVVAHGMAGGRPVGNQPGAASWAGADQGREDHRGDPGLLQLGQQPGIPLGRCRLGVRVEAIIKGQAQGLRLQWAGQAQGKCNQQVAQSGHRDKAGSRWWASIGRQLLWVSPPGNQCVGSRRCRKHVARLAPLLTQ